MTLTIPTAEGMAYKDRIIEDQRAQIKALELEVYSLKNFITPDAELEWLGRLGFTTYHARFISMLVKCPKVLSKGAAYEGLYGERHDAEQPDLKILDVYLCKIRERFRRIPDCPDSVIETVWGRGWILTESGRAWLKAKQEAYK